MVPIGPGAAHLDGELAGGVRQDTPSDFDRTRRAQEVMVALFKSCVHDAISDARHLQSIYQRGEKDISLNDLLPVLNIAPSFWDNDPL